MKKYLLLVLMVLLLFNGCAKEEKTEKTQDNIKCVEESTEESEVEEPLETSPKEEDESVINSEQTETVETESTEEAAKPSPPVTEKKPTIENKDEHTTAEKQPPIEEEQVSVPVASYNPNTIVQLATEKLRARGKVTLTENLDRLLAEGSITKEEYEAYYPYDGAGYYSVFMETNLHEAKTTSGRKLSSEEEIAEHIAEMLALEPGPYFLIEYAGVYTTGGTEFYEFRCYRA